MSKTIFAVLLGALGLCWGCRPNKNLQNGQKTDLLTSSENTTPDSLLRFEPDPYSALVDLETSVGTIRIELFFHTPNHRENMIKVIKEGRYNDVLFHRVIKDFMVQGGDPTSRNAKKGARLGGGGAGYELENEINSQYFHIKGALAAARQPDEVNPEKKSSGMQFYIVHGRPVSDDQLDRNERKYGIAYSPEQRKLYRQYGGAPQLDMEYTVFGRVYQGFDVVQRIATSPTDGNDRPETDVKMRFKIVRE